MRDIAEICLPVMGYFHEREAFNCYLLFYYFANQ